MPSPGSQRRPLGKIAGLRADVVLDNTGTLARLRDQIAALWTVLTSAAARQ